MKLCARTVKACLRGCSDGECDLAAMAGPAATISGDRYQEGIRSTVTRCANWLFNRGEGELCGAMLEELGDLGWEGVPDVTDCEILKGAKIAITKTLRVKGPIRFVDAFSPDLDIIEPGLRGRISRKLDADMVRYFQEHFPAKMDIDSSVGTPYLDTLDPEFRARIEARAGAVRAVGRFIRALGDPE